MTLWWEPNSTPRIWSGPRHFCWKFFVAEIPFLGVMMVLLYLMVGGRAITVVEALIFFSFLACVTALGVWLDRRSVPLSYHFRGDVLVVNYWDGSQAEFARWVRTRKLTTGIIHAQNDTRTIEIREAMYAAPVPASEPVTGK